MVNDEEVILGKLNCLCGTKHDIFSWVKMLMRRLLVQASTSGVGSKEIYEDKGKEARNDGIDGSISSKILSHFFKRNFFFNTYENNLDYSQ
jgi:hypothetical protein